MSIMNKWVSPLTGQLVEYEVAQAHGAEIKAMQQNEMVEHPDHYRGKDGLEVITVIRAFGLDQSFELGSAVKYLLRSGKKGSKIENIKKARQVLDMWLAEHGTEKE